MPLVSGAAVVLAPPGAEGDSAAIVSSVLEHEVTVLQAVPSVYTMLSEDAWLAGFSRGGAGLRAVERPLRSQA